MRRFARSFMALFQHTRRTPIRRTQLSLESLENRAVPTANASGVLSGFAYIDINANGVFDASERSVPGVAVTLEGSILNGDVINVSATTDANGAFTFQNVQPGAYKLSAGPAAGLIGGVASLTTIATPEGVVFNPEIDTDAANVTQDVGFAGVAPQFISMRQFKTDTVVADFPFAPAGSGTSAASDRENNLPTVTAIADVNVAASSSQTMLDLAGFFSDPDFTNSQVRVETSFGDVNIELFDTQTPRTVANFFNYILSDRYDNTIFHRSSTGFVLQGGGFEFNSDPSSLDAIDTDPAIQNEFQTSNTLGTVAMAKVGGDPNSATSQFFFNLGNNSANLDNQNGGFTVFGKLVSAADQTVVNTLAAIPPRNMGGTFNEIPLINYSGNNFPTDTTAENYELISDVVVVRRTEALTYSVVANSNEGLVTATIENNRLFLNYTPSATGTATITLRATDKFGASVETTFNVNVT